MKNTILFFIIIFNLFSCKNEDKCNNLTPIPKTEKLKVGDKSPGFYPVGNNDSSFSDLKNERILFFFKTPKDDIPEGFNQEIEHPIYQKLKSTNTDIVVISDLKLAKAYGVLSKDIKIETNYLFIMDENKIIRKIYKNICILDINKIVFDD